MKLSGFYLFRPFEDQGLDQDVRLVIYDNINNAYDHFKVIKPREHYQLNHSDLNYGLNHKYKYQIMGNSSDRKWVDIEGGYKNLIPEITDESGLQYVFYPAQKNSNKLVVCFQAIQTNPSYNYIRTLADININRLYIKDGYGMDEKTHSSYYINEGNPIAVDDLVQKIINEYIDYLKITKENTIFIGSSKGGYAALYHGYKFGAGHIIVGGAQVLLGNYLFGRSEDAIGPPIFKALFGELTDENKEYGNSLLYKILSQAKKPYPNTVIHIGRGEPHYKEHALPLIKWAEELNIENLCLDIEDYNTHEELVQYYPLFLKKKVDEIILS